MPKYTVILSEHITYKGTFEASSPEEAHQLAVAELCSGNMKQVNNGIDPLEDSYIEEVA